MDNIVDEGVNMSVVNTNRSSAMYSNTNTSSNDDDQMGTGSRDKKECGEFLRGYIDCAQESIRFLTEEEGMSIDHPVIEELQTGLLKHIQILQMQLLLRVVIQLGSEEGDADTEFIHRTANLVPEQLQESDDCLPSPQELDNETVAASIAEKISKIVFHRDTEDEESEISDVEMSTDEDIHEQ